MQQWGQFLAVSLKTFQDLLLSLLTRDVSGGEIFTEIPIDPGNLSARLFIVKTYRANPGYDRFCVSIIFQVCQTSLQQYFADAFAAGLFRSTHRAKPAGSGIIAAVIGKGDDFLV